MLVAAGFAIGAAFHAADFLRFGCWPYTFGPPVLNLFWNALLPIDLAIVAGLLLQWRFALPGALLVIAIDVVANAYAWLWLGFTAFAGALPFQAAFGVLVLMVTLRYRAGGPFTTG